MEKQSAVDEKMLSFNSGVHVSRLFSRVKSRQTFLFTIMKCIIIPKGSNCTMSLDGHDKLCGYQKSLFPTHIALESTFYKYGPLTMTLK